MVDYETLIDSLPENWQPSASLGILKLRADKLRSTRAFFFDNGCLEVETPCLSNSIAAEQHIEPFKFTFQNEQYYLQTSPELAMKRLLASGSGAIYQLANVFRTAETGCLHNPEFKLLEWYQPDWTYVQLMQQVDEFVRLIIGTEIILQQTEYFSYQYVFQKYVNVDPFADSQARLVKAVHEAGVNLTGIALESRDQWLDLLFSHVIQPRLPKDTPVFIHEFPVSQAALAEIKESDNDKTPNVALRFELIINGIELANGFQELRNAKEQLRRFELVNENRIEQQQSPLDIDLKFIAALKQGLPKCAGVAVGFDRLMMLALNKENIQDVMAFAWQTK